MLSRPGRMEMSAVGPALDTFELTLKVQPGFFLLNLYRLKVLWSWRRKHGRNWNGPNASWKET